MRQKLGIEGAEVQAQETIDLDGDIGPSTKWRFTQRGWVHREVTRRRLTCVVARVGCGKGRRRTSVVKRGRLQGC